MSRRLPDWGPRSGEYLTPANDPHECWTPDALHTEGQPYPPAVGAIWRCNECGQKWRWTKSFWRQIWGGYEQEWVKTP